MRASHMDAEFAAFLRGREPLFVRPIDSAGRANVYCPCHAGWPARCAFYARAVVLGLLLRTDCNRLKLWFLRWCGAQVGRDVYLAPGVWLDPIYPQLLTLEDEVFVGVGAKLALHEFRAREFRAGRIAIRRGAVIGGWALLGPGVEIGAGATVAAGAAIGRDVPSGATAIGNPARVVRGSANAESAA